MKKLLSVIICFAVLASSLALFPSAAAEFTMSDAKVLIDLLAEHAQILWYGETGGLYKSENVSHEIGVKITKHLYGDKYQIENYPEGTFSANIFYPLDEYKSPEYWKERFGTFLTSEYIEENFEEIFIEGVIYCDGEMFIRPGAVAQSHISGEATFEDFEDKKLTVNGDTAQLTCLYELPFDQGYQKITFEFRYTENTWKISGGTATNTYFGIAPNANTADASLFIILCLLVSFLGIASVSFKRRFLNA
jgi:hypothetical protein